MKVPVSMRLSPKGIGGALGRNSSGGAAPGAGMMGRGATPANPLFVSMVSGMGAGGATGTAGSGKKRSSPYSGGGNSRSNPYTGAGQGRSRWSRMGRTLSQYGNRSMSFISRNGGRALNVASKAAVPLMVAGGAYQAYNIAADQNSSTRDKVIAGSELAGGFVGGAAGAKLGATIGTMLLPGIGTAIGTALGGMAGYVAGEWAAGETAEKATESMQGELKISIDSDGQPRVRQISANDRLALDVDTGMSMGVIE